MKISLIVAVYERVDFLRLVLESIRRQTFRDFEVIIAEDGCSDKVAALVAAYQGRGEVVVTHLTQEDVGFRKARILNRAVSESRGDFLVFIDGDCILHRYFLGRYARRARENLCLFGRRVMLGRTITESLIAQGEAYTLHLFRVLVSKSRKKEEAIYGPFLPTRRKKGVLGCSFCVSRDKMVAINGFDEDFTHPYYGEDTDVERRLRLMGVGVVCTRYATIQYHLFHNAGDRSGAWAISEALYRKKTLMHSTWCANGIIKSS